MRCIDGSESDLESSLLSNPSLLPIGKLLPGNKKAITDDLSDEDEYFPEQPSTNKSLYPNSLDEETTKTTDLVEDSSLLDIYNQFSAASSVTVGSEMSEAHNSLAVTKRTEVMMEQKKVIHVKSLTTVGIDGRFHLNPTKEEKDNSNVPGITPFRSKRLHVKRIKKRKPRGELKKNVYTLRQPTYAYDNTGHRVKYNEMVKDCCNPHQKLSAGVPSSRKLKSHKDRLVRQKCARTSKYRVDDDSDVVSVRSTPCGYLPPLSYVSTNKIKPKKHSPPKKILPSPKKRGGLLPAMDTNQDRSTPLGFASSSNHKELRRISVPYRSGSNAESTIFIRKTNQQSQVGDVAPPRLVV